MENKTQDSSQQAENTWSRMITPHGEVDVETTPDGKNTYYPLKTEELKPLPGFIRESHISEMKLFHSTLMYIKEHHPKRPAPVFRFEILKLGADPRLLRQLVEAGLLKESLYPLKTGSRACFYYTDQGRALIRKKVDPTYALTENT